MLVGDCQLIEKADACLCTVLPSEQQQFPE